MAKKDICCGTSDWRIYFVLTYINYVNSLARSKHQQLYKCVFKVEKAREEDRRSSRKKKRFFSIKLIKEKKNSNLLNILNNGIPRNESQTNILEDT